MQTVAALRMKRVWQPACVRACLVTSVRPFEQWFTARFVSSTTSTGGVLGLELDGDPDVRGFKKSRRRRTHDISTIDISSSPLEAGPPEERRTESAAEEEWLSEPRSVLRPSKRQREGDGGGSAMRPNATLSQEVRMRVTNGTDTDI